MENVTLLAAFGAGLLSFISPCVLPLIPGLPLVHLGPVARRNARHAARSRSRARACATASSSPSLAFILGFSLVFVALGASASAIGQFMMSRLTILGRIAGAIIDALRPAHDGAAADRLALPGEARADDAARRPGFIGATLVGIAFAFGWTPVHRSDPRGHSRDCRRAEHDRRRACSCWRRIRSASAIPFFAAALAINRFFAAFARIRKHYHMIELTSGALLVIIGILIFTNRFTIIARTLQPYLPVY